MTTVRVEVKPELLRWARERAHLEVGALERAFPKLAEWERQETLPTLKQLQQYAKRTRAPLGFFFLPEPPDEPVPIPDFRTFRDGPIARPSPELLDTVYICQMRQDWYREYAETPGENRLAFVGSLTPTRDVVEAAAGIRRAIGLKGDDRTGGTWENALRDLVEAIEEYGVLVMRNGVVGNNTHRPLDVDEFRGFALSDPWAPLIFVNARDTKAAQMFTLVHELVHVFIGRSALSDVSPRTLPDIEIERWCNQVAAEVLVPLGIFRNEYRPDSDLVGEMRKLSGKFKVSTLVILRRMHDAGGLDRNELWSAYDAELQRLRNLRKVKKEPGGDFYASEAVRVSPRFARALIQSTLEGNTLYRDAFRLLEIRKERTFKAFSAELDIEF